MRRRIFNVLILVLTFMTMISVTFGWWIEGVISDSFIIKSAKISSEITIYEGNDFNHDGNLDKDDPATTTIDEQFTLLEKTEKNNKQILVLKFSNFIPTEVYTWKIKVENNGDAAGYVYASLWDKVSTLTSDQKNMIKYMSIKIMGASDDTKVYLGKVLANSEYKTILFGGKDTDIVDIGQSKDYIFQIQVETFDDLVEEGVFTDSDDERQAYQALQGKVTADDASFEFLDVSLSSAKPQQPNDEN